MTGLMGSGKSAVTRRLGELGATVLSADEAARAVTAPGSVGLAEIVAAFGPEVLHADGSLDRQGLADRVFGDPEAVALLNAITHPRIRALLESEILQVEARGERVVVLEIPLLSPAHVRSWGLDGVVVVVAPEDVTLRRLGARGVSVEAARARWAHQLPSSTLKAMADWVIENNGSLEELVLQVDRVWADLLKREPRCDDSFR